jgi:prepilin-type N-terminal cleavage/methylation domain-containing protein
MPARQQTCRKPGRGVVFSSIQHLFGRAIIGFIYLNQYIIHRLCVAHILHNWRTGNNITERFAMHHPNFPQRQSGFTLIEIAIVLVIIGLLLGGILKGQELINSARVKNLATDFRNVPLFIYGYQDKFRALPGDDPAANTFRGAEPAAGTVGNGTSKALGTAKDDGTESYLFWQHVRLAGLAPGSTNTTADDYAPVNAVGGRIGIQSAKPFTGINGTYFVCSTGILGKYAKQLDIQLDDGNTDRLNDGRRHSH